MKTHLEWAQEYFGDDAPAPRLEAVIAAAKKEAEQRGFARGFREGREAAARHLDEHAAGYRRPDQTAERFEMERKASQIRALTLPGGDA